MRNIMHSYENYAKYLKAFCATSIIFFASMVLFSFIKKSSTSNLIVWCICCLISIIGFFIAHILNYHIAMKQITGHCKKSDLKNDIEETFIKYEQDCGDKSLSAFVYQELSFLKTDIKKFIFIHDLAEKLEEIKKEGAINV